LAPNCAAPAAVTRPPVPAPIMARSYVAIPHHLLTLELRGD
jgi:hypothetical protein